jgi:uncharacterized protein (TIGR02300 family)
LDVAKPELGLKRQCANCSTKFFDLNRNPIVCPKCGTVFVTTAAHVAHGEEAEEDAAEAAPANVELVSLEDAEASESKAAEPAVDDIEVEDDGAADEPFLEEEEEDADDVSNLIDGEISPDEEP